MLGPTRTFAGFDFTETKRGIGKRVVLPTSDANVLPASKPSAMTGVEMIMRRIIRSVYSGFRGKARTFVAHLPIEGFAIYFPRVTGLI